MDFNERGIKMCKDNWTSFDNLYFFFPGKGDFWNLGKAYRSENLFEQYV